MKKVLLSSVAALAVFSAAAPVFADNNPLTFDSKNYRPAAPANEKRQTKPETSTGDNVNPDGTLKRVVPNGTHARVNVSDRLGAPVAGVTVDFLVNGVASQAVTDANGDASIAAPVGTTVRYRVAAAPAGYFQNANQEGAIVVGGDMFTNAYLVIEKTDSYLNPNYTPGSDNKPADKSAADKPAADEPSAKPEEGKPGVADQAKKSAEAAKKAGVDAKAGQKALPKTHAAK
mgnify:CR=1 FL=1